MNKNKPCISLSKELINIILTYDNRYKKNYTECVNSLHKYFYTNRLCCYIQHEKSLYEIHSKEAHLTINSFSFYKLKKLRIFGCLMEYDNLKHYKLNAI